ncbi:MAG TPA: tRNA (adenosine(37)-N6)-threonylcarbamoyltransferase complex ATPase subunit type 1 TsaE [Candidatus Acidoferrales bacterium]|nr:tRNA (adenosine(37)-N6)-threonylcarbamoyltransferase complex ATPase subunit type 1 TsaE [Candidatus Acidoferrales bacterium]
MARREIVTNSTEETIAQGREIGESLKPPVLVLLTGELGAGKTTLTKGIVSGLGASAEEDVTSPTFTLVHKYAGMNVVYHVDLYRIGDFHDFETLGLEDLFAEKAVVIVEWAEKLPLRTNWPLVQIELEHITEEQRRIKVINGVPDGASEP